MQGDKCFNAITHAINELSCDKFEASDWASCNNCMYNYNNNYYSICYHRNQFDMVRSMLLHIGLVKANVYAILFIYSMDDKFLYLISDL